MANRVTLSQVAQRAGVSNGSASRALHGSGASPEMVARVRAVAADLGYRVNVAGRSLRTHRTHQVAFAVADIGNPVYVDMLTAIHAVLSPQGYRTVVSSIGPTISSALDLVKTLDDGYVDGVIMSPLTINDELVAALMDVQIPVVTIGRPLREHGITSVATDSSEGIALAVRHLVEVGRRRIGFVNGPTTTTPGQARLRGFEDVARDLSGSVSTAAPVAAEDFTVAGGVKAGEVLLQREAIAGRPVDAIVAANDLLAIGVIRAARLRGLRVPQDLAVTGMDDTEIGRVFQPSLTTVSLGSGQRGQLAAEHMLRLLGDGGIGSEEIIVGPELLVRESSTGREAS